jgi:hypothetical protein
MAARQQAPALRRKPLAPRRGRAYSSLHRTTPQPDPKEPTMNTTTTLTQRTLSLLLAATATLVMVLAIDGLAQRDTAADALLAQRAATASTRA